MHLYSRQCSSPITNHHNTGNQNRTGTLLLTRDFLTMNFITAWTMSLPYRNDLGRWYIVSTLIHHWISSALAFTFHRISHHSLIAFPLSRSFLSPLRLPIPPYLHRLDDFYYAEPSMNCTVRRKRNEVSDHRMLDSN